MKRSTFQVLMVVAMVVFVTAVVSVRTLNAGEKSILNGATVLGTNSDALATTTEPLVLKLPAPVNKSGQFVLPSGPNIEPYSDESPPPFLVPKGIKNVAAGRPVSTSVKPFTGEPSQLTDGKKEAMDYDMVEMKKGAQWIQVDLGGEYTIYAIAMWHDLRYWTQTMHDVIVQVSDDLEFKTGVTTLFNNDRDNSSGVGIGSDLEYFETHFGRVVDGKGVKARYVRGYTNGSNLWRGNSWQELEVYGLPADSIRGAVILSSTTELLALRLPAPTLKGTPENLPVGPNIEPLPSKPPPPFLVPTGATNVAAGRDVSSSSPPTSGKLSQITDGTKEAFDFDRVAMKSGLQWVQVDLGEAYAIYAVAMWHDHRYTQTMHDVIVQVAEDPEFQKGVMTLFNNDRDNSSGVGIGTDLEYFETHFGRVIDGKGVKARYVRGYTNGSNLWRGNSWQELEVYGLPADAKSGAVILSSTNSLAKDTEPLKLKLPAPSLK